MNVSSNGCARRYLYLAATFGRTRSPWLLQLPSWKAAHARDSTHVSGRQLCDLGCGYEEFAETLPSQLCIHGGHAKALHFMKATL